MTAPVIPLIGYFDNPLTYEARVREQRRGQGAYAVLQKDGQNGVRQGWQVSGVIQGQAAFQALEGFLRDRQGVYPFRFQWDGQDEAYHDAALFRCPSWDFVWRGLEVWDFSGRFVQTFRLGEV